MLPISTFIKRVLARHYGSLILLCARREGNIVGGCVQGVLALICSSKLLLAQMLVYWFEKEMKN